MSGLLATIGVNAGPGKAGLKEFAAAAEQSGHRAEASLKASIKALEKQIAIQQHATASMKAMGATASAMYKTELAGIESNRAALKLLNAERDRMRDSRNKDQTSDQNLRNPYRTTLQGKQYATFTGAGVDESLLVKFKDIKERQARLDIVPRFPLLSVGEASDQKADAAAQLDNLTRKLGSTRRVLRRDNVVVENEKRRPGTNVAPEILSGISKEDRDSAATEQAARDNRARAIRRDRSEERAGRAADASEAQRKAGVEAATRMNRARAIRRERSEEREARAEAAKANSLGGRLREFGSSVVGRFLGIGAAIGAVYGTIRQGWDSIQAHITVQRIEGTLKAVSGSLKQVTSDFAFLKTESSRVGFAFASAAEGFARFSVAATSAGMSGQQTRDIFTAIQEAGVVMGMTTEQVGASMLALEQMMSKGTVMSQELRLQLGNAMPGAMDTFARALGVTQKRLYEMVEAGEVLAASALPKFAAQLKKSFPLDDEVNKTARDINRLKNELFFLKAELGKSLSNPLGPVMKSLSGLIDNARIMLNLFRQYPNTSTAAAAGVGVLTIAVTGLGTALMAISGPLAIVAGAAMLLAAASGKLGSWWGGGAVLTPEAEKGGDPRRVAMNAASKKAEEEKAATAAEYKSILETGLSVLDAQAKKESSLNTLLNSRIRILKEMEGVKDKNSAQFAVLSRSLSKTQDQISLETADGPIEKEKAELRIIQSRLEEEKAIQKGPVKNTEEVAKAEQKVKSATTEGELSAAQEELRAAANPLTVSQKDIDAKNAVLFETMKKAKETSASVKAQFDAGDISEQTANIAFEKQVKRFTEAHAQVGKNNATLNSVDPEKLAAKKTDIDGFEIKAEAKKESIAILVAKEIKKIEAETTAEKEKQLSLEQKRAFLIQTIHRLEASIKAKEFEGTSDLENATNQRDLEKARNDLKASNGSKPDKPIRGNEHLTAMQKIGAFTAGGPSSEMLNVARRSERYLAIIAAEAKVKPPRQKPDARIGRVHHG